MEFSIIIQVRYRCLEDIPVLVQVKTDIWDTDADGHYFLRLSDVTLCSAAAVFCGPESS